jgi:CobQ-like glutamine amidotransferase family enzyme
MTQNQNYSLKIGWLYPTLMNIYGDKGNVTTLVNRSLWRNIKASVIELNPGFSAKDLNDCDLLIMGGAQDSQQTIVNSDLKKQKEVLNKKILENTPGLYVCGGFQFLGKYYKEANGNIIEGLDIFDLYTENPGENVQRLIGNMAFTFSDLSYTLVGFENHGGRTYLGKNITEFGKVIKGFGNNGKDGLEGARFKNSFGTYSHGPILPKNPLFADYLIKLALETKYKKEISLEELDDTIENKARMAIANKLQIAI